ncbi:MAG: CsgG/HfaB family protein [Candidatus Neomarinimicrobiota bacterium]
MKTLILKLIVSIGILGQLSAQGDFNGSQTIAIFDFTGNGVSDDVVNTLTDRLRSEMIRFDNISVVERKRIDAVLEEQQIQLSGCADKCLIEVGKLVGSSSIIVGSIGKVGSYYTINARKINATTSKVENAIRYNIDQLLVEGMKEVSYRLILGTNPPKPKKPVPKNETYSKPGFDLAGFIVNSVFVGVGATTCVILVLTLRLAFNILS